MKVILILGFVASLAAAAAQFMVRNSLKEARATKDQLNRQTLQRHADVEKVNEVLRGLNEEITRTHGVARNEELSTLSLNSEIKQKQDQTEAVKREIASLEARKTEINTNIRLQLEGAGSPDEVMSQVEQLRMQNNDLVKELETLNKEVEVARREAAKHQELANRLQAQQDARNRAIELGSRTGTVSVVNHEYGFAVVNLGRNHGVSEDTRLIVKRGPQFIGRLNIVRIEATRTFADLDLRTGAQVMAGDDVIFESAATASR